EQRIDMRSYYQIRFLVLEGVWAPHNQTGMLMVVYPNGQWGHANPRGAKVPYSKLFRYLISVALSGTYVIHSKNLFETAYNICELFQYFQKKWTDHTSLRDFQKPTVPSMRFDSNAKKFQASLTQRWAADLDGIGTKYSEEADRYFKTPIRLANSEES